MDNWPSFLPPPLFVDFETYTEGAYNLKRMPTVNYIRDSRFFVQAMSYADPVRKTNGVLWHDDDIQGFFDGVDCANRTLVCHRTFFDGKIVKDEYDKLFGVYVCTEAMAKALLRHSVPGFSLEAVYEHLYGAKFKTDAVEQMAGILEVPVEKRAMFGRYALLDVIALFKVFCGLAKRMPDAQWWHMDWCLRQFIDPVLCIDRDECVQFIEEYERESEALYGHYDATVKDFASAAKFAKLLRVHGGMFDPLEEIGKLGAPRIPIIQGARGVRYDFSKKSEGFINNVLESDDATIRHLGKLKLRAASSSEASQARSLIKVDEYASGEFGLAVNYCGTATTRISGNGDVCGLNVLAIKRGSRMRNALMAPKGFKILSLDMSAFELGICRFLAQDKPAMATLVRKDGDLYVDFARAAYKNPEITKATHPEAREVGKTSELQLQYGSGPKVLRSQLLEKGVHITIREAQNFVDIFRDTQHKDLTNYWRKFSRYLPMLRRPGLDEPVLNAPFLRLVTGGILMPNGLTLMFPDLRQRDGQWSFRSTLGTTLSRDHIYGAKLMQYCCQGLANCIIQEKKRAVARETGLRIVHEVYDDISMLIPEDFYQSDIDTVTSIAVRSLSWWPELPLACEWGVGSSWGGAKKDNPVFGENIV